MPSICALVCVCLSPLFVAAQTAANSSTAAANAEENRPTFRVTSRLVLVDVVVTGKKGEFIRGLQPINFIVLENGREQKITGFNAHSSFATGEEAAQKLQLPPNIHSNFRTPEPGHPISIVLFDLLNTAYLERIYAKQQMLKFLSSMPEGEPVALFVLGSKLRMLQGFTQSSDALIAAAKQILNSNESAHLETSGQELSDAAAMDDIMKDASGLAPASAVSIAGSLSDEVGAQTNVRVFSTLRSLQAMASMVAGYSGRKNLIWLSADFPVAFGPGFDLAFVSAPGSSTRAGTNNANMYVDELHKTSTLLASSEIAVYPISVRGLTTQAPSAASMVKPAGPARQSFARWATQTTMDDIAKETGGEAFYSQNDLRKLIERSMDEGTNYYTLAYVPQDHTWDGRYRKIEVRVALDGAKLHYREGYYAAPDIATDQKTAAQLLASAMQPAVPESTSILFKVQVLPPTAERKTVSIDFAVSPSDLSFADTPDQRKAATVDFMAVALDRNQKEAGVASNTVAAAMRPAAYQQILKTGFPGHLDLEVKPGRYLLRLGVIDRNTERIGTLDVSLTVPEVTAANRQQAR
jgi:VWFA-related protein